MNIGWLRHKVVLQRLTVTQGRGGAKEEMWHSVATVYADIGDIRGKESLEAGKVTSEVTTRIWIRYRSDVTPLMRIQGQRLYSIIAVLYPHGQQRMLELLCNEVV